MRSSPNRKGAASRLLGFGLGALLLSLFLCGGAQATFRPTDVNDVGLLHGALRRWDAAEALRRGKELLRQRPQDPQVLSALGWAEFYSGNYEKALELAEKARSLSPNPETQSQTAFFAQTLSVIGPLHEVRSAHFVLRFQDPEDRVLSAYALNALEAIYAKMSREFGFTPAAPVRVEILPDAESFHKVSTLSRRDIEETGAVGITKFNKIMLISPRALLRGYRWLDAVVHEYIHVMIVKLSGNNSPIWFHEGLAKYEESRWRGNRSLYLSPLNQTLLARAVRSGRFVSFAQMEPSLVNLDSPEKIQLAYAEGASAIDYLTVEDGTDSVRRVLADMKTLGEGSARKAIEEVTGTPFAAFEAGWKNFLRGKKLREIDGVGLPDYTVKAGGVVDTEAQELKHIRSLVARNHVRLGDMFVARGQNSVAVLEYRRGLTKDPHSAYILNKLAAALIREGRGEEALPYLQEILATNPDYGAAYRLLGDVYWRSGRLQESRRAYEQVIQINPYDPVVHARLSELYSRLGDSSRARQEREMANLLSSLPGR